MSLLKTLRRSLSFRLTLNYGLLSLATTLILVAFIHAQVIEALRGEHARQITATAQRLGVVFEEQGRAGLMAAIALTLSDRIDADRELYLLLDETQQKLVGNLDAVPPGGDAANAQNGAVFAAPISHNGRMGDGYLSIQPLADGATLIVGHDASEISDLTRLIGRAAAAAIFLALCLVMLGAIAFRRTLDYRVGQIRRTTQQIRAGQLSRRVPTGAAAAQGDEFTLLVHDINAMLDRIELLMKNARHLSDTIAHNLRTPLTRIMGALQSARSARASHTEVWQANQDAIDGIAQLNVLLEKLLQIADMEAGIRRRAFKPCDLARIAADVLDMYEPLAEDKGIRLHRARCDAVMVAGDASLLASALANVLDNAVKHAAGQVVVQVFAQGGKGCVVIADDGPGLPATEYEHLGKHFYRVDASADGHGLGLTSVMSIVGLHGGTGLTVTVRLPGIAANMTKK